ncbi:50S ribosomal protein L29 [Kallotenue papyrolyticum]|uniref:50S ribosomal protein L29 n=1 Tax=Kallotenue papyrolyticum TaxID=1325125 RepID=UPI0004785ECF|nr:50S ribosomal protein L29 [Kallotenue papyrolyticum]
MKASELRQFDNGRLTERLREIDQELFNLRFHQKTGRLTNPARIGELKKEYARIKTILRERELAEMERGS